MIFVGQKFNQILLNFYIVHYMEFQNFCYLIHKDFLLLNYSHFINENLFLHLHMTFTYVSHFSSGHSTS
jgi:hypothetical protein